MGKKYPFEWMEEDGLMVVIVSLNHNKLRFLIDTGASDTVVDMNTLIIEQIELKKIVG